MRVRAPIVRRWQESKNRPYFYAGPSMGADRAAWMAAVKAESAARRERHFNQSLYDLVKCFDTVQHHKLVRAAHTHGYPMHILRLSLRAYRIQRTIGVGGVYSVMIIAVRSITAG